MLFLDVKSLYRIDMYPIFVLIYILCSVTTNLPSFDAISIDDFMAEFSQLQMADNDCVQTEEPTKSYYVTIPINSYFIFFCKTCATPGEGVLIWKYIPFDSHTMTNIKIDKDNFLVDGTSSLHVKQVTKNGMYYSYYDGRIICEYFAIVIDVINEDMERVILLQNLPNQKPDPNDYQYIVLEEIVDDYQVKNSVAVQDAKPFEEFITVHDITVTKVYTTNKVSGCSHCNTTGIRKIVMECYYDITDVNFDRNDYQEKSLVYLKILKSKGHNKISCNDPNVSVGEQAGDTRYLVIYEPCYVICPDINRIKYLQDQKKNRANALVTSSELFAEAQDAVILTIELGGTATMSCDAKNVAPYSLYRWRAVIFDLEEERKIIAQQYLSIIYMNRRYGNRWRIDFYSNLIIKELVLDDFGLSFQCFSHHKLMTTYTLKLSPAGWSMFNLLGVTFDYLCLYSVCAALGYMCIMMLNNLNIQNKLW